MCGLDEWTLLAVEFGSLQMTLKKSLINHPQSWTGTFTARQFGKGDAFGCLLLWVVGVQKYDSPSILDKDVWRGVHEGDAREVCKWVN